MPGLEKGLREMLRYVFRTPKCGICRDSLSKEQYETPVVIFKENKIILCTLCSERLINHIKEKALTNWKNSVTSKVGV